MKVKSLWYNWRTIDDGVVCSCAKVGEKGVTKIDDHDARFEGDKWYFDIWYGPDKMERIFNPNKVEYVKEEF